MKKNKSDYKTVVDNLKSEKEVNTQLLKTIHLLQKSNKELQLMLDTVTDSLDLTKRELLFYEKSMRNASKYEDEINLLRRTINKLKKEKLEYSYMISVLLDSDKKC